MPGFYGLQSVIASRNKHIATGKVITSAVLKVRGSGDTYTSVPYANAYVWPVQDVTGLPDNQAVQHTTIVLWQMGETTAPVSDDQITEGGNTWLVTSVTTRLNADTNYAVHDCTVSRAA